MTEGLVAGEGFAIDALEENNPSDDNIPVSSKSTTLAKNISLTDPAYGAGSMLGWMVQEKGIEPHVPVWDKTERKDGTFSSSEFVWDEQANEYRCPEGHALRSDSRAFKNPRTHHQSGHDYLPI